MMTVSPSRVKVHKRKLRLSYADLNENHTPLAGFFVDIFYRMLQKSGNDCAEHGWKFTYASKESFLFFYFFNFFKFIFFFFFYWADFH